MSSFALRLAVLPSVILLLFVVGRNKKRRNPTKLLVLLAVFGALSTIPAAIVEIIGSGILYRTGLRSHDVMYHFIDCFFIVAMIEELGKFLCMIIISWKDKNFDHSYDGVIYGVCTSLGFATLENVLYIFRGGIGLGFVRAVSAVPLHCACGVVMGYFYSRAKEMSNRYDSAGSCGNLILAYISALGIHGLYDFVLSVEDSSFAVCCAVLLLAVALMVLLIFFSASNDHIISSQPIWVDPYNFRYMPGGQQQYPYGQQMPGNQQQYPYGQQMPGNQQQYYPYGQQMPGGQQQYYPYGQQMPGGQQQYYPYGQQMPGNQQQYYPYGNQMPGNQQQYYPYGRQMPGNQQYPYGQNDPNGYTQYQDKNIQ